MMGTRCGAIDPGVLIYLMETERMDAHALEDLIYRRSGLLGVSGGISSDMRTLRSSDAPGAKEAVGLFMHRIIREAGSLAAAMGGIDGIDGIVLTADIGENDAASRPEIMRGCRWLGLSLDEERNAIGEGRISADNSRVAAWVIPKDEERMIARHTQTVLGLLISTCRRQGGADLPAPERSSISCQDRLPASCAASFPRGKAHLWTRRGCCKTMVSS
ncbi:MAG: hypothetical protein ACJ8AW_45140 [Rhodopila sp.]